MTDADGSQDTALAAWPEDLRKAWASLRLPSLHDLVVAQERLAAEIRRQNQELRRLAEARVPAAETVVQDDWLRLLRPLEAQVRENRSAQSRILIAVADAVENQVRAMDEAAEETERLIPRTIGLLRRQPAWRTQVSRILEGQIAGASMVATKIADALDQLGIRPLCPPIGTPFDPAEMRAVGTVPGAEPNRIARVLRPGYRDRSDLIRPADVVITSQEIA